MPIIDRVTQVSVGSSEYVWALDAITNSIFRRSPVTQNFEPVASNIEVAFLDVNHDGHVVALDKLGVLYHWVPSQQSFEPADIERKFDQVSIGAETVWALSGDVVFRWNTDINEFEPVFEGATALAVAKQDDAVYILDGAGSKSLLKFDYDNDDWEVVTSELGAENLTSLAATSESNLWASTSDGKLYQLNTVNFANADTPASTFFPQSEELNISNLDVTQFSVDEKGILYGVVNGELRAFDTEAVNIQNTLAEKISTPVLTTDAFGILHLAFSTEGGVQHSYLLDGEWIGAQPIPGAETASEIFLGSDAQGNIFASWIQGVGNEAEVYLAKGIRNAGYGGYTWKNAAPVTQDDVEDLNLGMQIASDGTVTLTSTKIDAFNAHDDQDVYSYSVDGNSSNFQLAESPENTENVGAILFVDPRDGFFDSGDGPSKFGDITFSHWGTYSSSAEFKKAGTASITAWFKVSNTPDDKLVQIYFQANAGVDFLKIKLFKQLENFIPELKLTGFVNVSENQNLTKETERFDSGVGIQLNLSIDLLNTFFRVFGSKAVEALRDVGVDYQVGLTGLEKITLVLSSTAALDQLQGIQSIPITLLDENGQAITSETPLENIQASLDPTEVTKYAINTAFSFFGPIFGSDASDAGDAPPDLASQEKFRFDVFLLNGIYASLEINPEKIKAPVNVIDPENSDKELALKFKAKLATSIAAQTDTASVEGSLGRVELSKITSRTTLDVTLSFITMRLLDFQYNLKGEDGDLAAASSDPIIEYIVGGTSAVHGDGVLVLGGTENGSKSDTLDSEAFNYLLLPTGQAFGVYIQETLDQSESQLNTVNTIDGQFDPTTGEIVWDASSIAVLPNSAGANLSPKIAVDGDEKLLVTWGNVASDNPDLNDVTGTPPGKAYVIFGGEDQKTIDLGTLENDAFTTDDGFYYSNNQSLFSIGASAAQLGNLREKGTPKDISDFAFGAPDAQGEAGKAYVFFGEKYFEVTDIDALQGTKGFTITGEPDSELGFAISTAGDFNGDEIADVAITAPGAGDQAGAVYVLYGGNDWTYNQGQLSVDDIGGAIEGAVLLGQNASGRWGDAVSGGYDVTGDGQDDLAIGSIKDSEISIVSLDAKPIIIGYLADEAEGSQSSNFGLSPLGNALAILPDIDHDGNADLLIGSNGGDAFVVFGGDSLATYGKNYVVSWAPDRAYQVVLSFDGTDADGNGILSAQEGEISSWRMEVIEDGQRVADYGLAEQLQTAAFDFNYDTNSGRVLVNSGAGKTDPENDEYGLFVGLDRSAQPTGVIWALASNAADQKVELVRQADTTDVVTASEALANDLFDKLSDPGRFDLEHLDELYRGGFNLSAATALPLQVANAGDVNGDRINDLIVGFDESENENEDDVSGQSYVLFGSPDLRLRSSILDLDNLRPEQGFIISNAGGVVAGAGDVNGDKRDDLLVSSPGYANPDVTSSDQNGISYVIGLNDEGVLETLMTLEDTANLERSGASLSALGDLNNDGHGDVLVGAPHAIDPNDYYNAVADSQLLFSTRDLSRPTGTWSNGIPLGPDVTGQEPAAVGDTPLGILATWVVGVVDDQGDIIGYQLVGSFFDGQKWSADGSGSGPVSQVIRASENLIDQVNITQLDAQKFSKKVPAVFWVETDLETSQTTTLLQTKFDSVFASWDSTPAVVDPRSSESPKYAPDNPAQSLVSGAETVSVQDVHANESDGSAKFSVTRTGDLSQASELFEFRLYEYGATYGSDFGGQHSGVFAFAAGQSSHDIEVQIYDDDLDEGALEQLRLEVTPLDNTTDDARAGTKLPAPQTISATLFIEDNESVLDLASIDSGFKLNGRTEIALGNDITTVGVLRDEGLSDFLIAAPTNGPDNQGTIYFLYGTPSAGFDYQDFDLDKIGEKQGSIITGSVENGQAGSSLAYGSSGDTKLIGIGAPGVTNQTSQGQVHILSGDTLINNAAINLDASNSLILKSAEQNSGDGFGRSIQFANLNNSGEVDDLIVMSNSAVYVVYDILSLGLTGETTIEDIAGVTKIRNSEGSGFGDDIAVTDFDGNGYADLFIGVDEGNRLVDQFDIVQGAGGFVAMIRGSDAGFGSEIDVNALDGRVARFLGQAELTSTEIAAKANPIDGGLDEPVRPGFALLDGAGAALAVVDLNGDGIDDLAIGAPDASIADPNGVQTQYGLGAGRVYVLFGGTAGVTDWKTLSGNYELMDLYGDSAQHPDRFGDGIVLEGTQTTGNAGSSLSNVGFFRGTTDQSQNAEDLAVGAPGANSGAGQAYLTFGSEINFADLKKAQNVFKLDPTANSNKPGVLPIFTYQGPANALDSDNPTNVGALGASVAGLGDIDAMEFGSTGGTDLAIGAPSTDIDGRSETYVATGHPWIQPGQSLDAEDLRSDNGFIVPELSGRVKPAGDFNLDGYDDFLISEGDSLTIVLGASTFDVGDFNKRVITLDTRDGLFSQVTAGDYNGDGATEVVATIKDGDDIYVAMYTPEALDDPDVTDLSPKKVSAPPALADVVTATEGLNIRQVFLNTADVNGDGYDDLFFDAYYNLAGRPQDRSYVNAFVLGTPVAGEFRVPDGGGRIIDVGFVFGAADLNGDGRDEILVAPSDMDERTRYPTPDRIKAWDEDTQSLPWAALLKWGDPLLITGEPIVYLPGSSGDINGDGFEDTTISIRSYPRDSSSLAVNETAIVLGAKDLDDVQYIGITPDKFAGLLPRGPEPNYNFSTILGDVNQDGFDDILVSQQDGRQDAFVIFGGKDLPSSIELPNAANAANFEYGYAIKGLSERELPYKIGTGGDINGDGVSDLILSDDTKFDLTYAVFGERKSGLLGVNYIDGTAEDDYLIQKADSNTTVNILAKEGDDFIQTLSGYEVYVFAGEGDDKIGLAQVDSAEIGRIDGGTGFDTLFLNVDRLGALNTLDITNSPGRITGIEVVDLGTRNGLAFDVPSIMSMTGSANTLIVKGTDALAKPKISKEHNGWSVTGENTYDGDIYTVYSYQTPIGEDTNIQVWLQQGGVAWRSILTGTSGKDDLKGTNGPEEIYALGGRDTVFAGSGDDVVFAGSGNDHVKGGAGNDQIIGAEGRDEIYGDSGDDILDGGKGRDLLSGGRGDDVLEGGQHNDVLLGGWGSDFLAGGNGNDILSGGRGNDFLAGGKGNDILLGGRDDDIFVFEDRGGQDSIYGFEQVHDKIDLTAFKYDDFGQLESAIVGGSRFTKIDLGDTIISIFGFAFTDLGEDDFIL